MDQEEIIKQVKEAVKNLNARKPDYVYEGLISITECNSDLEYYLSDLEKEECEWRVEFFRINKSEAIL